MKMMSILLKILLTIIAKRIPMILVAALMPLPKMIIHPQQVNFLDMIFIVQKCIGVKISLLPV